MTNEQEVERVAGIIYDAVNPTLPKWDEIKGVEFSHWQVTTLARQAARAVLAARAALSPQASTNDARAEDK